ncbi:hypothetical protein EON62_05985, partial [archaeon]
MSYRPARGSPCASDGDIVRTIHALNLRDEATHMSGSRRVPGGSMGAARPARRGGSGHRTAVSPRRTAPINEREGWSGGSEEASGGAGYVMGERGATSSSSGSSWPLTADASWRSSGGAGEHTPHSAQLIDSLAPVRTIRQLEGERDAYCTRASVLEHALSSLVHMFQEHVSAVEASVGSNASQMYTVTFGEGGIGMILSVRDDGIVEVAELREDAATGKPLLARASGRIALGDRVLAVGDQLLTRNGKPTAQQIAVDFRTPRPFTVLF